MKTNLNLFFGMIIGSFLTLLLVFFLKPAFLNPVNRSADKSLTIETQTLESSSQPTAPCNESCLNTIIENLIAGTNLSNEFGVSIREENAKKVAKKLQTQTETVKKIEDSLRSLKGQDDRDAILFTFSYLPVEQLEQFSLRFLSSENAQDRSDALSMLYHIAAASKKAEAILEQVINKDSNEELTIDAIQILYGAYPDHAGGVPRQRLNQFLNSETSDEIKSNALQTKAHLLETNEELKQDIINALNSPVTLLKETGIQVLDSILSRQSNGNTQGDWNADETLRMTIEGIANNKEAAPFTRVEALNLMRRHYN